MLPLPRSSSRVFSNSVWLGILQLLNIGLPLVLLPFLVRTLGSETSGVVFFGFSIVMLAAVGTDFGFNLAATYRIAAVRDDDHALSEIVTSVLVAKLLVTVLVGVVFAGFVVFQSTYDEHRPFLLLLLLSVVGQAFQPVWFFQGIERMVNIAVLTGAARLLYVGAVLLVVEGPDDYILIAVANGVSLLLAAGAGLGRMLTCGYRWRWSGWRAVWLTLRESSAFFASRGANAVYTYGGTFLLGISAGPIQVAHYSAAEQLYRGGQSLVNPIVQALFPHMTRTRDLRFLQKWLRWIVGASIVAAVAGVVLGEWVLALMFGDQYRDSYGTLAIFILVFLVATPSVILGYPLFGAMGDIRPANRSVVFGGVVGCVLFAVLLFTENVTGIAVALCILAVEVVVLVSRAVAGGRRLRYAR